MSDYLCQVRDNRPRNKPEAWGLAPYHALQSHRGEPPAEMPAKPRSGNPHRSHISPGGPHHGTSTTLRIGRRRCMSLDRMVGPVIGANHYRSMVEHQSPCSAGAEICNDRAWHDGTFDARFREANLQRKSAATLPGDAACCKATADRGACEEGSGRLQFCRWRHDGRYAARCRAEKRRARRSGRPKQVSQHRP
jgi:hypothetical protein